MGSPGPEIRTPKICQTIELKDLADIQDFEDDGPVGAVFGFELTTNGYYKRREIDIKTAIPRLEQLKNVDAKSATTDADYFLKKEGREWKITEFIKDIPWLLKFEFISPYALVKEPNYLSKVLNAGPLIHSLVPENKVDVKTTRYKGTKYMLQKTQAADNEVNLKLIPTITLGVGYTIVLDVIFKARIGNDVDIINGLNLSWTEEQIPKERQRVLMYVIKNAKSPDITFKSNFPVLRRILVQDLNLDLIYITYIDLLGLYYIDKGLSESELNQVASSLLTNED